jgi:flagellin
MTRINTNVGSLIAQKTLARSNTQLQESLTRLSTGLRINVGKDDPAGLIASEVLRSDIISVQRAITNSERANQIIATADSALGQVSSLLNDIRGLVSEAANTGALSDEQIAANQLQVDSSLEAIDRIAQTTSFQGRRLLDGSLDFITSTANGSGFSTGTIGATEGVAAAGEFGDQDGTPATGVLTAAAGDTITFTATVNGSDSNGLDVTFVLDAVAAGSETVDYTAGSNSATVHIHAASDTDDIVAALTADTTFANEFTAVGTGTDNWVLADDATDITTGGNEGNRIRLTAADTGAAFNDIEVTFVLDAASVGAETAAYVGTTLTVHAHANSTVTDVLAAINDQVTEFSAARIGSGNGTFAATTHNNVTSGGVSSNQFTLTALNAGSDYDNVTVNFTINAALGVGNETAAYDADTKTLLLTVDDASDVGDVVAAIASDVGTLFTATAVDGDTGVYTNADDQVNATTGGSGSGAYQNLRIDQANFGTLSQIDVDVIVDAQATKARLVYSGGDLTAGLSLQVGGKSGFEVFQFGDATTIDGIATALNLVSDATGVTATVDGTDLILESSEYGSDAFVSVQSLNATAFATTLADGLTPSGRTNGTDVSLRINGVQATGEGLKASLNTSTLDLSFSVDDSLIDGSTFTFSITGGGAIFQLGPDVVSNQQARLGIQGVSTSTLGGVSGSLYELRSGNDRDLATDVKGAAKIVDEVITSVTGLRGRLGAFQRTTLETNIFTLNDTIASLVEAESSIRDADFAVESARLTRAQILVQSGTSVLAIANQNPQNVLALLR